MSDLCTAYSYSYPYLPEEFKYLIPYRFCFWLQLNVRITTSVAKHLGPRWLTCLTCLVKNENGFQKEEWSNFNNIPISQYVCTYVAISPYLAQKIHSKWPTNTDKIDFLDTYYSGMS